jgi:hypothetical protein
MAGFSFVRRKALEFIVYRYTNRFVVVNVSRLTASLRCATAADGVRTFPDIFNKHAVPLFKLYLFRGFC